ncbi:MAG: DegT/DnrJ/EryC1/StrS aminotransferase family protein [Treponema sp.]|jgi:dTDP-4-amino-4,6-dideoxygalactose transaminase|nr:DegT/DnrJ/EryC1/StrS aminotransferase family protein [Treponema sp.]
MPLNGDFPEIPFARPLIGKGEEEAVLRVLRSGWLTTGRETLALEREFAEFLSPEKTAPLDAASGPVHCLAVNSATSGLHLALEACGVGRGDLVLVPSYTFASTAEVARYLGAEPVFVDSLPDGFHIDPEALEATLERLAKGLPAYPARPGRLKTGGFGPRGRAAAVVPVHYGGLPCDMGAIGAIARRYGLKIVEDAAHSFPSLIPGGPGSGDPAFAGTLGDAGVFSFYATKTITTGEGGMVACRDPKLAARMALMRSHGIDRSIWNRYTDTRASWYYSVVEAGYKYNLPDLLSALGRVQLGRSREFLAMREEIAARYNAAFSGDPHFTVPPDGPGNAWHLYPLRLNPGSLSVSREDFARKLQERGVGISVHFIPLHTMPCYRNAYALEEGDFPQALRTFSRTISLPIWQGMSVEMVGRVISVVKALARQYNS